MQSLPDGSDGQRAAEGRLLQLVRPFVTGVARDAWSGRRRTYLSRSDLEQEGMLHAQRLWRGFRAGAAGPGRTLYPAYVIRAVGQRVSAALAEAQTLPVTHHGRKLAARARRRQEGDVTLTFAEALAAEGADDATVQALSTRRERVQLREAASYADESNVRRDELSEQARAVAALKLLPRQQRIAVAGGMGLLRDDGRATPDFALARQLGCTVHDVREFRVHGLAALREILAADGTP